jgi:hypothetical protein
MSGSLNASTGAARPDGATAAAADVPAQRMVRSRQCGHHATGGEAPRPEGVAPVCRLTLTAALSGRGGGLATQSGWLLSGRRWAYDPPFPGRCSRSGAGPWRAARVVWTDAVPERHPRAGCHVTRPHREEPSIGGLLNPHARCGCDGEGAAVTAGHACGHLA